MDGRYQLHRATMNRDLNQLAVKRVTSSDKTTETRTQSVHRLGREFTVNTKKVDKIYQKYTQESVTSVYSAESLNYDFKMPVETREARLRREFDQRVHEILEKTK